VSKGSPVVPMRIPSELLAEIERAIEGRNSRAPGEPWTRTGFIITAIREKLAKMERSRSGRKRSREVAEPPQLGDQASDE
jgi:hypothetical protein